MELLGVLVLLLSVFSTTASLRSHMLTLLLSQSGDGSRQPSALELEVATIQGESFYNAIKRVNFA